MKILERGGWIARKVRARGGELTVNCSILGFPLTVKSDLAGLREREQLLPEADASTKYTRFYSGNGNSQGLRQLTVCPAFGFLQDEGVLERRVEAMKCFSGQFFAHVLALRILTAIFDLWKGPWLVLRVARIVIVGDAFGVALAQLHESFVDRNADQPGRKLRIAFKAIDMVERFDQNVLEIVFRILAISEHVERESVNLAGVPAHEFGKSFFVSRLSSCDQLPFRNIRLEIHFGNTPLQDFQSVRD
jgi:hypothetical protein